MKSGGRVQRGLASAGHYRRAVSLCIGSFADRYDYRKIIAVIFLAFAVACAFLSFAPSSSYISLAGIGHGIALNPFWGLIAAYISFFFAPAETMRIDAMGLAAFGPASGLASGRSAPGPTTAARWARYTPSSPPGPWPWPAC